MASEKAPILSPAPQPCGSPESCGICGWVEEKSGEILMGLVTSIPTSVLTPAENPYRVSEELIEKAATAAAIQSGALAFPGGPFGLVTIIPDLMNIWRIQSQLVADIAAVHGKVAYLGRQEMAWCLFRHAATQIARDFIVRAGQRALVAQLSHKALSAVLRKVGTRSVERLSGRFLLRLIPLLGMAVSAGYAWWDTRDVGRAAVELFGKPSST